MQPRPIALSPERFLLVTLIVKLAIAATLSTMLVRFRGFRRILLTERRAWRERLTFAVLLGLPLVAGVASRLLLHYGAADLTLSGSFLAGLIAGPYAGALVGAGMGLPPLFNHEYAALPFAIGCGFAGGGLREICPKEEIWKFSPFFVTKLPQSLWRLVRNLTLDWQMILVTAPVLLEVLHLAIWHRYPTRIFLLQSPVDFPSAQLPIGSGVADLAPPTLTGLDSTLLTVATVLGVAIPIKIWNSARIEHRLAEQEQLLMQARVEALANQINPHFLFNTLTSISSLIRSQPETARLLIGKLSGLLRRLLRSQEHFVTLREELEAVGEYLDIERIRFGPSLVVDTAIDADSLDMVVPSMILQPIVENSIKHGLSRKRGEGRITIRSERRAGHVVLEVLDNGVGFPPEAEASPSTSGIGLKNINERLRVVYGANYQLRLTSAPGGGTSVRIEIPELIALERAERASA